MTRRSKLNLAGAGMAALVATFFVSAVFAWSFAKDPTTTISNPAGSDPVEETIFFIDDGAVSAIITNTLEFCAKAALDDAGANYCSPAVPISAVAQATGAVPDNGNLVVTFVPPGPWTDVFPGLPNLTRGCITGSVALDGGGEQPLQGADGGLLCQDIVTNGNGGGGGEGCTPGFWKTKPHQDDWANTAYDQSQLFDDVFGSDPGTGLTLLEAVGLKGNSLNSLIRHAVAGILNATHDDVDYDLTAAEVIAIFQDGVKDGGVHDLASAKGLLQGLNEQGCEIPN